jgi:hypothetical protein
MMPASLHFWANSAFSERNPYLSKVAGCQQKKTTEGERARMAEAHAPRVDHVDAVLQSDADDIVLGEVGGNRGEALAHLVGLVGLTGRKAGKIGRSAMT